MNRAGIAKVGAFTVVYGENAPSLLLVLTHASLDSVVSLRERMAADAEYTRAGAAILDAPLADPPFVRVESTLLRAIEAMPTLEPSAGAARDDAAHLRAAHLREPQRQGRAQQAEDVQRRRGADLPQDGPHARLLR